MRKVSRSRSLAKTILWRVIATGITWTIVYAYTGKRSETSVITFTAAAVLMLAYYVHERIWARIRLR